MSDVLHRATQKPGKSLDETLYVKSLQDKEGIVPPKTSMEEIGHNGMDRNFTQARWKNIHD